MYILPVPHLLQPKQGEFILKYNVEILLSEKLTSKEFLYAKILMKQVEETLKFSPEISKAGKSRPNSIYLSLTEELKPEEYKLEILSDRVEIAGGNRNALLYGVQTLRQIILQRGAVLPCVEILDYPEVVNRGFYHDITRGRIPTLAYLKTLADKLSLYKINQLQLYVEHSFLFRGLSEVWRDDTPLTAQEIMELDEYCQNRNIELIPSMASFGHLYKLLRTRTYGELCELDSSDQKEFSFVDRMLHHTVDVTNEKSFELIKKLIFEYMPLFSSEQFNICADETFDLGKGKSWLLADSIGTDQVYVMFLKRICQLILSAGKKPMFWGDIILSKPEIIQEIKKDVICLNWDYSETVTGDNAKKLYELGVRQYLCPGVHGWKRMINQNYYAYENVSRMCRYAHLYKAEGLLNTDWGDYGHLNPPEFSMVGMIYGAAFSWNSKILPFDEINKQISVIEYGDKSGGFVGLVNEIACQEGILWGDAVEYKEARQGRIAPEDGLELKNKINTIDLVYSNEKITQAVSGMYHLLGELDFTGRNRVKAYLIMAEGILLFNRIGLTIRSNIAGTPFLESSGNPNRLAEELEYWWKDYKSIWREDSRESELYRIQEVIFWYADFLRNFEERHRKQGDSI